jgi:hypothetical protein
MRPDFEKRPQSHNSWVQVSPGPPLAGSVKSCLNRLKVLMPSVSLQICQLTDPSQLNDRGVRSNLRV